MENKKYTPCGGCGAETPMDRCLGCFHPFEPFFRNEYIEWVNLADNYTEDWQTMHCRYASDGRKLDTDLFEEKDNGLVKMGGSGRLEYKEVEYMVSLPTLKAQQGGVWMRGTKGFPVKKHVIAKKFISHLNKEVVGTASSATGEMICFDWGVSSVCLAIGHEELNDLVWLDESPNAYQELKERGQKLADTLEWIQRYGPGDQTTKNFITKALSAWNGNGQKKEGEDDRDEIINFSEWAATIAFFDDGTRLWELMGEGEAINGQFRFSTKEFIEVYRQQKG